MDKIRAKTILSPIKEDPWFGIRYNMNLYRGCQHACIYCDSRSLCYKLGNGSRDYFYKKLDSHFPGMKERYIKEFGNYHHCFSLNTKELYEHFYKITKSAGIPDRMIHYQAPESTQLTLF